MCAVLCLTNSSSLNPKDDDTAPPSVTRALITQIEEKYGGTSAFTEHEQMIMESMGAAYGGAELLNSQSLGILSFYFVAATDTVGPFVPAFFGFHYQWRYYRFSDQLGCNVFYSCHGFIPRCSKESTSRIGPPRWLQEAANFWRLFHSTLRQSYHIGMYAMACCCSFGGLTLSHRGWWVQWVQNPQRNDGDSCEFATLFSLMVHWKTKGGHTIS